MGGDGAMGRQNEAGGSATDGTGGFGADAPGMGFIGYGWGEPQAAAGYYGVSDEAGFTASFASRLLDITLGYLLESAFNAAVSFARSPAVNHFSIDTPHTDPMGYSYGTAESLGYGADDSPTFGGTNE